MAVECLSPPGRLSNMERTRRKCGSGEGQCPLHFEADAMPQWRHAEGTLMAYPITDIRGIGPDTAEILKSEGIRTTIGLLRSAKTPKQRLKIAEMTGTDKERVLDWVTTADRMRVKGVGWEYSQLLRAAGVKTVNELKFRNPHH